jgi:hypothetical protein
MSVRWRAASRVHPPARRSACLCSGLVGVAQRPPLTPSTSPPCPRARRARCDPESRLAHQTLIHETLHCCGPGLSGPDSVDTEELITELASAAIAAEDLGCEIAALVLVYWHLIEAAIAIVLATVSADAAAALAALADSALEIKGLRGELAPAEARAMLIAGACTRLRAVTTEPAVTWSSCDHHRDLRLWASSADPLRLS